MKNLTILLITILSLNGLASPLDFNQEAKLISHMTEVNAEWTNWYNQDFGFSLKFNSEEERIKMHLLLVINTLEKADLSHLNKDQIKKRNSALANLKEYAKAMHFPVNTNHTNRIPYFIDQNNTACAVGQMIRNSGHERIGQWVKSEMNNAYIAEIPFGKLDDWADEHGFSRKELAWIQPGYPPSLDGWTTMNQGLNGAARTLIEYDGKLIIAGEFTDASGLAANNVVAWNGSNFEAMGQGVNGWVNCSIIYQGKLTLGGSFNGGFADIAVWDGESWEYQAAFASKFSETHSLGIYLEKLYAGGVASGFAGQDFLLAIWENPNWSWAAEFEGGPIYSIEQIGNEMLVGGDFNSINILGDITEADNIAKFTNQGVWEEFNGGLDGFVKDIQIDNGSIIVAGKIKEGDENYFGLAYSNGNEWQSIIDENAFFANFLSNEETAYFNKAHFAEGDSAVCGMFSTVFGMTNGQSLAKIASQGGWTSGQPAFSTGGEINDFLKFQEHLYVAGDFELLTGVEFNNVAFFDSPNSIEEIADKLINIFPNPIEDNFILDLQTDIKLQAVQLYNIEGKKVNLVLNESSSPYQFNIENLPKGVYTMQLETSLGIFSKQLIKN